jgi:hypothetical protein
VSNFLQLLAHDDIDGARDVLLALQPNANRAYTKVEVVREEIADIQHANEEERASA